MEIVQVGLSGQPTTPGIAIENLSGEKESILLGTSTGVFIFTDEGKLDRYFQSASPVTSILAMGDVTGDGRKDLVVSTADIAFPNVQAYDSATGERLWDFSPRAEVFDPYVLWTVQQTAVHDMELLPDMDADEVGDVVLSAGYGVYALSGKTGKPLWDFTDTDNVWDIIVLGDRVAAGDQNGAVILLDASGRVVWRRQLTAPYTVIDPAKNSPVGDVKRSVWDLVSSDGAVIASAEDGFVYSLDPATGEVLWNRNIIEYVDALLYQYYGDNPLPTGRHDYNFFNLRIAPVEDLTGDGRGDILASTFPGARAGSEYKGTEGLYLIDAAGGGLLWKNQNLDLSLIPRPESVGVLGSRILIPLASQGSRERLLLVDPKTGDSSFTMSINASADASGGTRFSTYLLKGVSRNRFLMFSGDGDLLMVNYPDRVVWNYPRLTSVEYLREDVVGDSSEDILIRSKEGAARDNPLDRGKTRSLIAMDGGTREIAWTFELPLPEFLSTGGLSDVKLGPDINGDGKRDIFGYLQHPGDWGRGDEFGNMTRILALSGKTGAVLLNASVTGATYYGAYEGLLTFPSTLNYSIYARLYQDAGTTAAEVAGWEDEDRIPFMQQLDQQFEQKRGDILGQGQDMRIRKRVESLDIISDMDGDGIDDLVIGGSSDAFVLDSVTGRAIWTRAYNPRFARDPFNGSISGDVWNWSSSDRHSLIAVGDANADAVDDLAMVTQEDILFLRSNMSGGLHYDHVSSFRTSSNFDKDRVVGLGDVNANGVRDILVEVWSQDGPSTLMVLDGSEGALILDVVREGTMMELAAADFDGDSVNDSLVFTMWGNEGGSLEVKSGRTRQVLWISSGMEETWMLWDLYGLSTIMPAAPVGDLNGDGASEIALARSQAWGPGGEIIIYDVRNGKELQRITVEQPDPSRKDARWMPGVDLEMLPDTNGDGKGELGAIMVLGQEGQKRSMVLIVDLEKGEVITDFVATGDRIIRLGDSVAVLGGSVIYILDASKSLSITSPAAEGGSPVRVEWESANPQAVALVSVDGNPTARATGKSATFNIAAGSHEIAVYEVDSYGKGMHASVTVGIQKGGGALWQALALAALALCLLFLPKVVRL